MRTLTFKLAVALFAVAMVSACSNTKTSGSGSEGGEGGVTSSGVGGNGVNGGTMTADGKILSSGNVIYFDFDQDVIRADGRDVLMTHASRLKKGGKAVLEGHADERGTREYNMALAERRSKAVRDFLVIQGVNSSQLEVVSYGEERPADASSSETAWAKNRRVEIK